MRLSIISSAVDTTSNFVGVACIIERVRFAQRDDLPVQSAIYRRADVIGQWYESREAAGKCSKLGIYLGHGLVALVEASSCES